MEHFYIKRKEMDITHQGKTIAISLIIKAFYEQEEFDGDNEDDIAAFKRGEFQMIGISVVACFHGLEGNDHLGMNCYRSDDDIVDTVKQYDMEKTAIEDLKYQIDLVLGVFK